MTRHRHTMRELVALFSREGGICHLCKQPVQVGQPWDVSHEIPIALGGGDNNSNWRVAHRVCHRVHTSDVDQPAIAKAKRREAAHIGARTRPVVKLRSAPFPRSERTAKREPKVMPPRRDIFSREIVK